MAFNEEQLQSVLKRKGYGVTGSVKGGITGGISLGAAASKAGGAGALNDMEPTAVLEQMAAEKLQVGYSGRPEIRITFYRHRLADHSRAVSEKALVDCLQYAGLISGDSESEIRLTDVTQEKIKTDEEERTEIEIIYEGVNYDNPWVSANKHAGR